MNCQVEKQRVAVARAIVNNPKFILADEPTGALDTKTSEQIVNLFYELNKQGSTIIMITHDREIGKDVKSLFVTETLFRIERIKLNIHENIRMAISSIFAHKMRSILTMLGIIIGISAIITILATGMEILQRCKRD